MCAKDFGKGKKGMILVYTGEGKGKTSAALGQTIRALGHGFRVVFLQFLKRDGQAGEQIFLKSQLKEDFWACGLGFVRSEENKRKQRQKIKEVFSWLEQKFAERPFLMVLDEIFYALNLGVIKPEEVEKIIDLARQKEVNLVLTGRNFPLDFLARVDMVSEIKEVKHPFQKGVKAKKGIDF
ncbi:MAG: cob(I)alamin adenosyltransferase [Desulfonauticus sp.]|nr:MAG: ATP:corrinoid adenosyltransferase BtuR/CobO/CobP [Desulfonauticus sp. 38_4375]MDK2922164.1 cob(I)alamin adenosyltransferase [Desulfonauticus sp.]